MKFNHKSLGGFDVVIRNFEGPLVKGQVRPMVSTKYRVMVTVDAEALAQMIGEKAVRNKKGITKLAGGAIMLVNLGGVPL